MMRFFKPFLACPKLALAVLVGLALVGVRVFDGLPVDVFPDIRAPQVVVQTEAGGLTAEEVEQQVTRPIESAVNGIPGVTGIRASSSGGLSFVWIDFDWSADLTRARFDVFERLSRVRESLPPDADTEIAPDVSVTGEIMLVALTSPSGAVSPLDLRARAEYDLRSRLLAVPGIGEVVVIGGQLPEVRIEADPRELAADGVTLNDVIEAARASRTQAGAGYLANVAGDEVPLRQVARADDLATLRRQPVTPGGALRLEDVATLREAGAPRRGSASYNGEPAVILSVQKTPGGNTPALTAQLDAVLDAFAAETKDAGIEIHREAYRQADFIGASIDGGTRVLRDAVLIVIVVLALILLKVRTLLIVLATIPLSVLAAVTCFPAFGLGVNVMTIGGFAVAVGDIVDAAIIFTEVIWRRLAENAALPEAERADKASVIAGAAASVLPGVLFSTTVILLVFLPLTMLSGIEGRLFSPLGLAYILVFAASFLVALVLVPAFSYVLWRPPKKPPQHGGDSIATRALKAAYRPVLRLALKAPVLVVLLAVALCAVACRVATTFGSSFLPSFREDSCNVSLSLPPGASLAESERLAEACVPALSQIDGVLSVTRRTGRAERDQHAEPVSSSEYVIRMDLSADTDRIRDDIRKTLGDIPGASVLVGYPIAHRISAVLSGTEAEIAINVFGEDPDRLRAAVADIKTALDAEPSVSDVRANREVSVRTLRIDYDTDALAEAGLTLRDAGEQVAAAFNGVETGEIRQGARRTSVTVRFRDIDDLSDENAVRALLLVGAKGRTVRLDEVARVVPEEASNLLLRDGGRRKALVSCNPAADANPGDTVKRLQTTLAPLAARYGCTLSFTGSSTARASAAKRLAGLGAALLVVVFGLVFAAVRSLRSTCLALLNVPLGLVGGIAAVALANPVLSVSSLVGFITVSGFTLRNGILLLNRYRERLEAGDAPKEAIAEGSVERMVPILMTSLTTVIGLVPLVLAGNEPGGEMLAPLAVVQLGGILGATFLNLLVLPAAAALLLRAPRPTASVSAAGLRTSVVLLPLALLLFAGCTSYEAMPIDWEKECDSWMNATNTVRLASADDAALLARIGNPGLNELRLKARGAARTAQEEGWWNDPSLDLDLNRILGSAPHPFLGGATLSFTLPLSGAPALDARAAEGYAAADAMAVRAEERTVAADARAAFLRLAYAREKARLLAAFAVDPRHTEAERKLDHLTERGETTRAERAANERRHHAREHLAVEARASVSEAEEALRALCGLAPSVRFELTDTALAGEDAPPPSVDPLAFVKHPRVQEKILRLNGSEAKLEAEIRRQYPDLKIGPAFSQEDGDNRAGLALGIDLPLWNRNRKAIAEAEATRDADRFAALRAWQNLVREDAAARRRLADLDDHTPPPPAREQDLDNLLRIGEILPADYLAALSDILDARLAELDWKRDRALAVRAIRDK